MTSCIIRVEVEESLRNERRVGTVNKDGWMNGGDRDAEDDSCCLLVCVLCFLLFF